MAQSLWHLPCSLPVNLLILDIKYKSITNEDCRSPIKLTSYTLECSKLLILFMSSSFYPLTSFKILFKHVQKVFSSLKDYIKNPSFWSIVFKLLFLITITKWKWVHCLKFQWQTKHLEYEEKRVKNSFYWLAE